MKYLAIITCILACSALAPPQPAASATFYKAGAPQTHHLFVGVYGSGMPEILRFPFVNGFPATSPDLIYQNVLPPLNVGADGTLLTRPLPSRAVKAWERSSFPTEFESGQPASYVAEPP